MGDVLFLALRRLRAPLIIIISVYAISVAGLTLIPGTGSDGKPETMSFFHAFYVMSYTATTIGFGEIPNPFTDAQRMWVTFSIYLSVVAWTYALGTVFAMTNDAAFRAMLARSIFNWRVRGIGERFYIICGYGQSGAMLARALDRDGARLVIIETREPRARGIALEEFASHPLALAADARVAEVLADAGIHSSHCAGLLALAGEDGINQAIAIGARVLNPDLFIIARAKTPDAELNLAAFDGVRVVNPFATFAENLRLAINAPAVLQIEDWLTSSQGSVCPPRIEVPRGRWMLIGYGRFGQAIAAMLDAEGIAWKAFDPNVDATGDARLIRGTQPGEFLRNTGLDGTDVLIAGTAIDAVNLGVTTLARRIKPDLFVAIRQNHVQDRALIEAAHANLEFVQSDLVVHECLQLLKTPMLGRFIAHLRGAGTELADATHARVLGVSGNRAPLAWAFECDIMQPGMFGAFFQRRGAALRVQHLLADPTSPLERLAVSALALERQGELICLPADDTELKPGDRLLFVGDDAARALQLRYLREPGTVAWVCSGCEPPRSALFRWLEQRSMRV